MRKVKKKEKLKQREKEKKRERRGKEDQKEENETVTVKRRCEHFVSESCCDLARDDLLGELDDMSDREPVSFELVRVVLDVTDVPVSPSSVIIELCEVSPCCSDWEFVKPQSYSLSKKRAHCCTDTQEEMRLNSESTPAFKMKNDTANTFAKFVYLLCEGPRKVRRRRKRMECDRKNNHREDKSVSGKVSV